MTRAETLAEHRGWKQALLTGLVFLLLAARVPLLWRSGEFVAEDSWVFFAGAWNLPWWDSILQPYAGYLHVLPRVLAELCSPLPLASQPYVYAGLGLALNAALLAAFYGPAFRSLVRADAARLAVVLLLALAPNAQNLGLLLGLHWYLAFVLVLLLLVPFPAGLTARVGAGLFILVTAWSSPSALVLTPAVVWLAWRERRRDERLKLGLLLVSLVVVAALVAFSRYTHPERTGAFEWSDLPAAFDRLVLRGWLGTAVLGPRLAALLGAKFAGLISVAGLGFAVWLGRTLWHHRAQRFARTAAALLGAGLLMAVFSLTRTAYVAELATLTLPVHTRYLTAPTLLLFVATAILAVNTLGGAAQLRLAVAVAGLQLVSLGAQNHWAQPPGRFHFRDAVPAITALDAAFARDGRPASLYVPCDVPYWGAVLERGGGVINPPATGLAAAIGAQQQADGSFTSWLGRFTPEPGGPWINHARLGRLEFTGVERGRVFFHDQSGRLLFTSPLLAPNWWQLEGTTGWQLLTPSQ